MTFTQFTAFAAVAKHLNVTKAANMLHVSQPSVFKKTHPQVDVTLRANSGGIIHQQILHGDLEIGVCSMAPSPSSMLYSEPYIPLKLVAFAAKNHPVAKKKELALSDLEHVPLIVRMDDDLQSTTHTVLNALRKQGYKLNIVMRCESPEAVQSAVTQNLGIGLLYYDAVKAAIERGSFKRIQIRGLEIEGRTYIVYHKERPLSPHAEEFLKLLRDWRDQQNAKSVHLRRKGISLMLPGE